MARNVFVDTGAWYALLDRRDNRHGEMAAAVQSLISAGTRLVTTDYVVDESCSLAKVRAGSLAATRFLDLLDGTAALDLEWVGPERFAKAKSLFRKYRDQDFSFTDCTSFTVMRERRIAQALTTDRHFRIAGFEILPARRRSGR